ncbi:leucine rich repeat protein 1 [Chamberlinius hualienensis]
MKVVCKLTVNVSQSASNKRPSWGCVHLGFDGKVDENQKKAVLLCQLGRCSQDRNKYILHKNVLTIHDRFIGEGRVSISFKSPSHTIFIDKAEVTQLKKLVLLIHQLSTTKDQLPTTLSDVPHHSLPNSFKQPIRSISVRDNSEYERKLVSPCPGFSESAISGYLTKIHISNCVLKLAPRHIRGLKLLELVLARNDLRSSTFIEIRSAVLESLSVINCVNETPPTNLFTRGISYQFANSLTVLNLSGNKWTTVPMGIFQFHNLSHLDLGSNFLKTIPDKLTDFQKLQELILSNNKLSDLPCTILNLRLVRLDISRNPFRFGDTLIRNEAPPVFSLVELASRAVLQYNFVLKEGELPLTLLGDLVNCSCCVCGQKYVTGTQRIRIGFDLATISSEIAYHVNDLYTTVVPIEGTLCRSYAQCYANKFIG